MNSFDGGGTTERDISIRMTLLELRVPRRRATNSALRHRTEFWLGKY